MNEQELQQAFLQYVAKRLGVKNEAELKQALQQLGEKGLAQLQQEFVQLIQQQATKAKFGAKLNYLKQLRGECPDGYEIEYYKKGGRVCKKCVQKMMKQEGGEMDPIEEFKCGRKMKKAGSKLKVACGAKMKKEK